MSSSQTIQSKKRQTRTNQRSVRFVGITFLLLLLVGTSGAVAYYYTQRNEQAVRASNLDNQIANLQAQIEALRQKMDSGALCVPNQNYTTCAEELQALNLQVASLTNDRNSLNDTLNLQRVRVLASSVNLNWAGCGDIGQSGCSAQSPLISAQELNSFAVECSASAPVCYAGYLKINWTSTQPLHLYVQFAISTGTATTTSNSGTTGNTLVPYPGGSALTNGDMISNFQNDACTYDVQDNPLRCPSGSLTYNATYIY